MGEPAPHAGPLCRCFRVPEARIREAIRDQNLSTVEQVTLATKAAGGCSSCYDDIQVILSQMRGAAPPAPAESSLTDDQRRDAVAKTLQEDILRLYEINEVKLEILDVQADRVVTRLDGRNVGTDLPSILTLKWYLVKMFSSACGRKMQQIETNMLEGVQSRAAS